MKNIGEIVDLEEPYNSMLFSLKNVDGYTQYLQDIYKRIVKEHNSVKAEIKALFELNENNYLKRISSHKKERESNPEGLFEVQIKDKIYRGIVEVAFIQHLFDANERTKKFINRKLNVKKNTILENYYPHEDIYINKKQHGVIVIGRNMDLNKKVFKMYETKRKQHKNTFPDYPEYIKLYYFMIDSPPSELAAIDKERLLNRMHKGELIVICSVYSVNQQNKQTRIIITRELSNFDLKLNNNYFSF